MMYTFDACIQFQFAYMKVKTLYVHITYYLLRRNKSHTVAILELPSNVLVHPFYLDVSSIYLILDPINLST